MTAVAESWYAPVGLRSASSRSSEAANRAERLASRTLLELKSFRAEFLECESEIEELRLADTAASPPLKPDSYATGKAFIAALPSTTPAPEVTVDADGELVFDWYGSGGRTVSVCAQALGKLVYAGRFGANRAMHGHAVMDTTVPREIVAAIKELRS